MLEFTQYQITSIIILLASLYLGNMICLFYIRDNLFFGTHHFNNYFWRYIILSEVYATLLGLVISNNSWQTGLLFFLGAFFINALIIAPSIISVLNIKHNIEYYKSYKYYNRDYEENDNAEKGGNWND